MLSIETNCNFGVLFRCLSYHLIFNMKEKNRVHKFLSLVSCFHIFIFIFTALFSLLHLKSYSKFLFLSLVPCQEPIIVTFCYYQIVRCKSGRQLIIHFMSDSSISELLIIYNLKQNF